MEEISTPHLMEEISIEAPRFGTLTGFAAGRGDPVLLMLHGVGGNGGGFAGQLAAFGARQRTIAWNAPGYLGSSPMPAANPQLRDYADAVIALLDALQIRAPVDLLGHSMGGLIASLVAAEHPARVRRLILSNCSSGHKTYPKEERERALKGRMAFDERDPVAYARGRVSNVLSASASPAVVEEAVAIMAKLRQPGFAQATVMISESDLFEHAARISTSTRVISGTEDKVTPEALNRRIAGAIGGAQFVSIAGTGHWTFLEKPAEFNRAVLEFLLSRNPKPSSGPGAPERSARARLRARGCRPARRSSRWRSAR
jgi:pimeloyl-ACP methyl ester carboxylesterase